jgi:hypothetical protein
LDNTTALACLPFAMLDTSQIQEIQRIFKRFKGLKIFKKIYPWKIWDRRR